MSFENKIKEWVSIDNKLKTVNEEAKILRQERNYINDDILEHVETNNLNNATVQISDGRLRFVNSKQTAPITLKYIEQCLGECIGNKEQVELIINYIKEKREVKYLPDIKRYYVKTD
jgi:hypothetical protein